jgi:hypothetical protein
MVFNLKSTFEITNEYVQDFFKSYFWRNMILWNKIKELYLLALVVKGYLIYLSRDLIVIYNSQVY